jgi:hypothetical protein
MGGLYGRHAGRFRPKRPAESALAAGCIDADLVVCRRTFGRSDEPLIETPHVHHVMWVMFTETGCWSFTRTPFRTVSCRRSKKRAVVCPGNFVRQTLRASGDS